MLIIYFWNQSWCTNSIKDSFVTSNKHKDVIFDATCIEIYFSNVTKIVNTRKMIHLTYGGLLMSEIQMKNQNGKANYSLMLNGTAIINAHQSIIDVKNDSNLCIFPK